jgi:hypothetical protein
MEKFILQALPLTHSPPYHEVQEDLVIDATWGGCQRCGSLQLMNLVDPNLLYASPHNDPSNSRVWDRHHTEFAEFVSNSIDKTNQIIEIGGSSGKLAILLKDKVAEYIVMDIIENKLKVNVKFVKGNCETYDFNASDTLVLSHVLEHLYNPFDFIKNCSKNKVRDIYISNPVMRVDLDIIPIDIEHTYFADDIDVQNMFERNNYKLVSKSTFGNHSYFLHFTYDQNEITPVNNLRPGRDDALVKSFMKRKKLLENLKLEGAIFVAPGGHFGQILYYYSKYPNIIGYLDNDKNKQGKRVYGTQFYTFPFDYIKTVESPKIVLYMRHYTDEIINQIMSINPSATIIKV